MGGFILIIVGMMILATLVAYITRRAAEKRQGELFSISHQLGLEFMAVGFLQPSRSFLDAFSNQNQPAETFEFLSRFAGFHPFGEGENPSIKNLIIGRQHDRDWSMFDYTYQTVSTDSNGNESRTNHTHGIVALRLPMVLPPLRLTPENVLHKVGQAFGKRELTFELEEFNKRYFVECADRQGAYDVLHPRAIEFLMTKPTRNWQMGAMMIVIAKNGLYQPQDVSNIYDEINGFVDLLPDYVQEDRGFTTRLQGALDN